MAENDRKTVNGGGERRPSNSNSNSNYNNSNNTNTNNESMTLRSGGGVVGSFTCHNNNCSNSISTNNNNNNRLDSEEQEPDGRYECAICMNWLNEPVLTTCGHRFCKSCLNNWLSDERQWCPMDNERITGDQDIFPDNFTRREIEQIKLRCPNAKLGCELIASPLEVERHRYNCPHRLEEEEREDEKEQHLYHHHGGGEEKCPFASIKCDFIGRPETNALEVHLKEDMALHLQLMLKALQQTAVSTWNPEKCLDPKTSSSLALPSLLNGHGHQHHHHHHHQQQQHQELEENNGSTSVLPSFSSSSSEEQLLQAMYQRIVVLEQRSCEQDVKIENLSKQLANCSCSVGQQNNGRSIPTTLSTTSTPSFDTHYSNGTILWEINNFPKLIEYLQSNANHLIYSRECYTSPFGYKFCARLNIQPKSVNMLSLHVHLMQSENDYHLDWPFNGRIRLCIVHPHDAKLSQHDTVMTNPEILAFHKPRERISTRGFGFVEYANISELMRKGFCDHVGRLVIKIQINIV